MDGADAIVTAGHRVRVRGAAWVVLERTAFADCALVRLSGVEAVNAGTTRTLLVPFDRPVRIDPPAALRLVRSRRWHHALRRVGLRARPFGSLSAAAATGIQLLPYQLEPALACLRHGATRVLIADAVGLGKTIQAGLLLNELASQHETFRALVVTPAGLRDQWSTELSHHFGLATTMADASWLAQIARELPGDVNPWTLPGIHVVSFDFLKRPEVLRPLEDVAWDVLVVDEAHAVTQATARRAAVHAVGLRSRRVLLLTATPHGGDDAQFDALCSIGESDPHGVSPLIFRRTRADAGIRSARRTVILPVRPSDTERRMHRLLERYTQRLCREALGRRDSRGWLVAIVLRKRALSSAASLSASADRRHRLLDARDAVIEHQLVLPLDGDIEDDEPDAVLGAPGFADVTSERRQLADLVAAAQLAAGAESKLRRLLRLLRRVREPVIVFTEYRDTLLRLEQAVARAGHETASMHGGLSSAERTRVQRAFNDGGQVLLATDAAAEGLNLHARCRTIVHYELPWSPTRLEQRAGRVDRLGQTRTVHEIALVADDTAERLVLAPLARRAARVRAGFPESSGMVSRMAESRVIDAVLGHRRVEPEPSRPAREPDIPVDPHLQREAATEAVRLADHRRWHSASGRAPVRRRTGAHGAVGAIARPHGPASRLVAVYTLSCSDSDGRPVHQEVMAAVLPLASGATRPTRETFHDLLRLHEPALRAAVISACAGRLDDARAQARRLASLLQRRDGVVTGALSSAAQQIVQAGLFDRRSIRAHALRQHAVATALDGVGPRPGADSVSPEAIELSAALLVVPR